MLSESRKMPASMRDWPKHATDSDRNNSVNLIIQPPYDETAASGVAGTFYWGRVQARFYSYFSKNGHVVACSYDPAPIKALFTFFQSALFTSSRMRSGDPCNWITMFSMTGV